MNEKSARVELGWIRKVSVSLGVVEGSYGRELPIGTILALPKDRTLPPGWEWLEPPEEMRDWLDELRVQEAEGRLVFTCFDDRRDGQECPIPSECEETNKCLVQLLVDAGWAPTGNELVDMGMGVASKCLGLIAKAYRLEGNEHDAEVLESGAAAIDVLARRTRAR